MQPQNLICFVTEIKGNVMLSLKDLDKLTPMAQVVVYTILPSGETVADSMNFPVLPCLNNKVRNSVMLQIVFVFFVFFFLRHINGWGSGNKNSILFVCIMGFQVSLNFSSSSELPGGKTSLTLKAAPGSLCSVRAIDQSLLLLQPENQLNIQSVSSNLLYKMFIVPVIHHVYECGLGRGCTFNTQECYRSGLKLRKHWKKRSIRRQQCLQVVYTVVKYVKVSLKNFFFIFIYMHFRSF